jgi:hypothetical protein
MANYTVRRWDDYRQRIEQFNVSAEHIQHGYGLILFMVGSVVKLALPTERLVEILHSSD